MGDLNAVDIAQALEEENDAVEALEAAIDLTVADTSVEAIEDRVADTNEAIEDSVADTVEAIEDRVAGGRGMRDCLEEGTENL